MSVNKTGEGSAWRKWDLQVQPIKDEWLTTIAQNNEKLRAAVREYLKKAVADDIAVIGITDHNCGAAVDHALSLVKDEGFDVAVMPGVEIDLGAGYQLLVIFNPEYRSRVGKASWEEAVAHFLNHTCRIPSPVFNTDGCAASTNEDPHVLLERICAEDIGIPIFAHSQSAKGLFNKTTPANRRQFFDQGPQRRYYFAVDHKTDPEVDKTRALLTGWSLKPSQFALVKTSDAHHASEVGNAFTWIKSDPTYEGLKQIVFDAASRVALTPEEPAHPTNVVSSIAFDVPATAKIQVKQSDGKHAQDAFCFAGVKKELRLSPYLNCFVGGRGSGKSTILNFLGQHATDATSSEAFWQKIQPTFDTADKSCFKFAGVEVFEFVGQSEVEAFATNKTAFTSAIYERADLLSEGALEQGEVRVLPLIDQLRGFRSIIEAAEQLRTDRQAKEKEKKTLEGSVKVTKSAEYLGIVEKITEKSSQRQRLESWRVRIVELREAVAQLVGSHFEPVTPDTEDEQGEAEGYEGDIVEPYVTAYRLARKDIVSAGKVLAEDNFMSLVGVEQSLASEIAEHEKQLSALLKKSGLSDENAIQAKSAPQRLVRISDDLDKIGKRLADKESEMAGYGLVLAKVDAAKREYELSIEAAIAPLVEVLEEQAKANDQKDIKNIGLRYFFDEDEAWREIANELYAHFSRSYRSSERPDFLKTYVLENRSVFAGSADEIRALLASETKDPGYLRFLRDVFAGSAGFHIFRTIRDVHLNDVSNYKRIQVTYDGKDIERASFGQKCTAVIVILLLFGNYPLIIDEPEAHLDSSLIANYLVPLIKRKKSNRQLIISTHNANFVVNGDAEKIFILRNDTGTSAVFEATIESLDHRAELLKLEGGPEAFIKRGEKLRIRS